MNIRFDSRNIIRADALTCVLVVFSLLSIFLAMASVQDVYAIAVFSKDEKPFNVSYDDWASKFWNQWIGKNTDQSTPKPGGCLLVNSNSNKSESMAMLMEDADVNTPPLQVCKISSDRGVIVPLWVGWCDTGTNKGFSEDQLTNCARRQNLGNIVSNVYVDGIPAAKLNVRQSLIPGSQTLEYKINSLNNINDFASKEFTLTIPEPQNTHKSNQVAGTWNAVSQGWWVFLKPLPLGQHTIRYVVQVSPTGPLTSPGTTPHSSDVTYKLNIAK
jgi:hypothetical protein